MFVKSSIVALGALVSTSAAHGIVASFLTDGVFNPGYNLDFFYARINKQASPPVAAWYEEAIDNGFVAPSSYGTPDINCNKNSEPGELTAKVAAGGNVTFQWNNWPHGIGPVLTYVAACKGNCSQVDQTTLLWVKIDESGFDTTTSTWAAQALIDDNSTWTTQVPSTLAPGGYVFRHEIIALHGGNSVGGAQNYPNCINIEITGSGTDVPVGVLGTALYTESAPGILFNPYASPLVYPLPGPALYTAGTSGGVSSAAPVAAPAAASTPATT